MKPVVARFFSSVCALAVACAFAAAPDASAASRPRSSGLSPDMAQRIDDLTANHVAEKRLAGAVTLVARRGAVVYFEAAGRRDVERGLPMERDSIFRLHSMTKPLTTVAALILMEEGALDLDDPVSKFIPEFERLDVHVRGAGDDIVTEPSSSAMTVHHLLTHQSGLTYAFMGPHPVHEIYKRIGWHDLGLSKPDYTLAEKVALLGGVPLVQHPGTNWRYSISTDVLARVVEIASGDSFRDFVKERITTPLGMSDTDFYVPEDKAHRLAAVYGPADGGGLVLLDDPETSAYTKEPVWVAGGSGLAGTAMDYYRFAQMVLDGGTLDGERLLSPETVALMLRDQLEDDRGMLSASPGRSFGYGGHVVLEAAGDEIPGAESEWGWSGSSATFFVVNPLQELVIVILTQMRPFNVNPIDDEIRRIVYGSIVD